MADIFLSYAREDLEKARQLATRLEQQGWSVFWDRARLLAGQDFDHVIETEIDQASCMIVIWSEISKKSDWVRGEADIGREQQKLIPIQIDGGKPPIAFRSRHTENFANWDGGLESEEFHKLKLAVTRLAGEPRLTVKTTADKFPAENPVVTLKPAKPVEDQPKLPFEPEMIVIPAGSFQMGGIQFDSEKPIHTVTFATPFKLGKYPITFDEYDEFARQTGRELPIDGGWGRERRPVINVNWQDAADYAAWLNKLSGKAYRLPSEAELEYACRAGSTSQYHWGDDDSQAKDYAWFSANSGGQSHPVGQKQANSFGLYDMTGNVWEWLQDCSHDHYQGAPDNGSAWTADSDSTLRVLRGGSWFNLPSTLRSANRSRNSAVYRNYDIGFRLAQDLP